MVNIFMKKVCHTKLYKEVSRGMLENGATLSAETRVSSLCKNHEYIIRSVYTPLLLICILLMVIVVVLVSGCSGSDGQKLEPGKAWERG